jgi:NAD+ kinase
VYGVNVLIVYKNNRQAHQLAGELSDELLNRGARVIATRRDDMTEAEQAPADLVFVLGGDGTLLHAARCFAGAGTPIIGVNLGTVGFLSSIEPENLQFCLDAIMRQEYDLEARIMIDAAVTRDNQLFYRGTALNDVVLRSRTSHTILVELMIDGKPHTTYQGDGIICATPTGSTAYSFSAGGPVIDNGLEALVITPICSHLSSSRSLVVSASSRLTLELNSDSSTDLAVDGQEELPLLKGDLVQIERSSLVTNLLRLQQVSSLERINHLRGRSKLDVRPYQC